MGKYWVSGGVKAKIGIQKLVFPNGLVIDSEKRQYRTTKVNRIFSLISSISWDKGEKPKNSSPLNEDESCLVAGTGLTPSLRSVVGPFGVAFGYC